MSRLATSRVFIGLVALLAGAGIASLAWALACSDDNREAEASGQVRITYEPGPQDAVGLIQRSGLFDDAAATVNREIALPSDLVVRVGGSQTETLGPRYAPRENTVYFPWTFILKSRADLLAARRDAPKFPNADIDRTLSHAMAFVLYHELAHGLVDELEVPVLGGEERTADSLATVLSLLLDIRGEALPLSAAVLHLATAEQSEPLTLDHFADAHGFRRQRAFDAICLVYGSSPDQHSDLLSEPHDLPHARAQSCPNEYQKLVRDWRQTLAPHLTQTGDLLPPEFEPPRE